MNETLDFRAIVDEAIKEVGDEAPRVIVEKENVFSRKK